MDARENKVTTEVKARTLASLGMVIMALAAILAIAAFLFAPSRNKLVLYILSGVFVLIAAGAFVLAANVKRKQPGWGVRGSRKFLRGFIAAILSVALFGSIVQLAANYEAFHYLDAGSMVQAIISLSILAWFLKSKKVRTFFSGRYHDQQ